ncbi:MAG: hypothetical protein ACK4GN_12620 [Runella sp.]
MKVRFIPKTLTDVVCFRNKTQAENSNEIQLVVVRPRGFYADLCLNQSPTHSGRVQGALGVSMSNQNQKTKMKTLELENYGVMEMASSECIESVGGGKTKIPKLGPWGIGIWIAEQIIAGWDDIKSGFNDATNGKPYNYKPQK